MTLVTVKSYLWERARNARTLLKQSRSRRSTAETQHLGLSVPLLVRAFETSAASKGEFLESQKQTQRWLRESRCWPGESVGQGRAANAAAASVACLPFSERTRCVLRWSLQMLPEFSCMVLAPHHRLLWVGRDLKGHLVPTPCHGRETSR